MTSASFRAMAPAAAALVGLEAILVGLSALVLVFDATQDGAQIDLLVQVTALALGAAVLFYASRYMVSIFVPTASRMKRTTVAAGGIIQFGLAGWMTWITLFDPVGDAVTNVIMGTLILLMLLAGGSALALLWAPSIAEANACADDDSATEAPAPT